MFAMLSSDAAVAVGSEQTLKYTPPRGSQLTGGTLGVSMYGNGYGPDASGTAVAYTPDYEYNASNVFFQCASGQPACSPGSYDYTGELSIPSGRGGNLYLSAGCGGEAGQSCDEGAYENAWSLVRLWWAHLLLANDSTPAAAGITGTLLTSAARGSEELTFTASDPEGPGIYTATVQIDGRTLYSATPNNNNGQCSPVGESNGLLMFDSSQPCPASESVDLPVNTTSLADGPHTLKVTLEDAAGNTSVVYDATITTHNAPELTAPPTIDAAGQPTVGSALTATPGEWTAPAGAGNPTYKYQWEDCTTQTTCQAIPAAQNATYTPTTDDTGHTLRLAVTAADNDGATTATSTTTTTIPAIENPIASLPGPAASTNPAPAGTPASPSTSQSTPNGTPASENAILRLNSPASITRAFAKRALRLTGLLTNNQGHPIADATIDLLQETDGTHTPTLIKHAQTSATGAFSVQIPAGASREIEAAYRALTSDQTYTATATIQETVKASAQLHFHWLKTPANPTANPNPTGTILLTGNVQGPIPHKGTLVQILVHWLGHWELIRNPRTNNKGQFHTTYQFHNSTGHFPFKARSPRRTNQLPLHPRLQQHHQHHHQITRPLRPSQTTRSGSVRLTVDLVWLG